MVDPVNLSTDMILEIGNIGRWIEAIGLVIFFWIGFQIINLLFNWGRKRILTNIQCDLIRIEKKVDKLLKERRQGKKK